MFFVKDSGDHSIVYVTDSEEDAIAVHDWYEENTIHRRSWTKSLYNITEVVPDPSPLEHTPMFYARAEHYGKEWLYSVQPVFTRTETATPKVSRQGHATFVSHYVKTTTAQEALDIMKEFCESLEVS